MTLTARDVPRLPRGVRLQQSDLAFGFLARDLTQDMLGKVMLEFSEGSHAVVDTIEQEQDGDAGEQAEA